MRKTLSQVFHSPRFLIGFIILMLILLTVIIFPFIFKGNPLESIGLGSFFKPGTYVSVYDTISAPVYTLKLSDAETKRLEGQITSDDLKNMKDWLALFGLPADTLDTSNIQDILQLWQNNYDPKLVFPGVTIAKNNAYKRLDAKLKGLLNTEDYAVSQSDPTTGQQTSNKTVKGSDYANVNDIANARSLPLGTDNFGRDVLKELVSATGTSLRMGLVAGVIATIIGIILGLLSGYVGGTLDDIIMFIINIFSVIPSFVLLILISYSIPQGNRGANTVAMIIGITAWVWTARSVRSQVISLRNRDHVNLSKLSGHSLVRIIVTDILPYIASYVVMAFILQISSAILSEATLSMIGLGPKTSDIATLGLMMNWATIYAAHLNGNWWAYYPVILVIALISFSFNLMNTGLDQVFNPQLRE